MKMRRQMAMIVMVVSCLLQQGCYMFVDREGKYFASTKEAWSSRHGEWWPHLRTTGDCVMLTGELIPVVGWVTLLPAGFVLNVAECCVVAPAFDTVLLPIDSFDNMRLQMEEENYQEARCRLESNLDAVLADSEYWGKRTHDKLHYLNRWLSGQCGKKSLSDKQVSAILSILRSWLKGQSNIDGRIMHDIQGIVKGAYKKSCERESLDMLAKGLVEIKGATKVPMFKVIPYEIELAMQHVTEEKDRVKFNDEQLIVLRDADIMSTAITRVLKMRQKKHAKEVNEQKVN